MINDKIYSYLFNYNIFVTNILLNYTYVFNQILIILTNINRTSYCYRHMQSSMIFSNNKNVCQIR
jgi:hypothetical protein